ncbi:ABC-type transport system substrate-binding protein [Thermocatellispora tengchongensis]|uniref:ABC-type transport system substrate-binding protein n=1 Tax=Thermocatellispora tengchongensis TaxID=1073253 RepID=A0A840PFU5_9ACTN|nr:hypothetical protein [Thermocatellispora tengchongensis]MBB5136711.1 ABC-type transport system substrate-binding protein [Thermocatellispora tengchongensis]
MIPGFTSTLPDPSGLMFSFVGKANMKANFLNAANFTTDTVEKNYPALAPESAATYDREARWAATRAVLTEVAEQVPYVPLFTRQNVYTMASGLTYLRSPSFYDKVSGTWIDLVRSSK